MAASQSYNSERLLQRICLPLQQFFFVPFIKQRHSMKRQLLTLLMAATAMALQAATVTDTIFTRAAHEDFAFGADVSFVPMMAGTRWLDKNGRQKDILLILKEQGINNIRLRVWTVGSGASSKQEVVSMCQRAKQRGMGVMIDFHYSDTWADPGNQTIPSAWKDHSVEALAKNIYDHTYDVLKAVKATGANIKWVQVGNETKRGMLYPVGQTNKGGSVAFAKFVKSGYDAVKAVDSTMQVIVHLPDGHDNSLYRSIFDGLKKNGAKWDIIGLSAYPRWSHLDGPTMISRVMANINDLKSRYKTPCMVVETGHYPREAVVGNQYLVGLMDRMIRNGDLGCFYWEPESFQGYDMGAWDAASMRPTVMMDAFLGIKHTEVSWVLRGSMKAPTNGQTVSSDEPLTLEAAVTHIRKSRPTTATFYIDGTPKGKVTGTAHSLEVSGLKRGIHRVWADVADDAGNTLTTDTVVFFVGESMVANAPTLTNQNAKGGTAEWTVDLPSAGSYAFYFLYSGSTLHACDLNVGNDSIGRIYFTKNHNYYIKKDGEVSQGGKTTVRLSATSTSGLPDIQELRIFRLDDEADITAIESTAALLPADGNEPVEVYSLTGVLLRRTTAGEAGVPYGWDGRPCVINCVGGTPYIVRKQRLK